MARRRRPGAGRPPKPLEEKQRNIVRAKLTDGELGQLEEAAEGEPLGTYLRRLILRHLQRKR